MTKLEIINKSLERLNTPNRAFTVKLENGIYCLYINNKYILCGSESIIDDLIHGFIMGFYIGRESLYKEL
jgi:hypothetical protein